MDQQSQSYLPNLPDLALYNICSFISCPFDLLNFGNTCSRIRRISQSPSLWWSLGFKCFSGLWIHMEEGSVEENARDWMLNLMNSYSMKSVRTKKECYFPNGDTWQRADNIKFRFLVNLLRLGYTREKDDNPAVLYEELIYDIGVYRRVNNNNETTLDLSKETILQLTSLSQASERDLIRRKQPYKDHKYYIHQVGVSSKDKWMQDLFPSGPNGSICPLLMCPLQETVTNEVTGLHGLAMCLSIILEKHLQMHYRSSNLCLTKVWEIIKIFSTVFVSEIEDLVPILGQENRGTMSLRSVVLVAIERDMYDPGQLQQLLTCFGINLKAKDIILDLCFFLMKYEGIDQAVDEIRMRLRKLISKEIQQVLFPNDTKASVVSRLNLTDSDLIGGDNNRQEMASAAFMSQHGVLVTWHVNGRMRY